MKVISVLGSTGSIGTQTLDVISAFPEAFKVVGLAAGRNMALLAEQIQQFSPEVVSIADAQDIETLRLHLQDTALPEILTGAEGLQIVASLNQVDTVVVGVSGFTGLIPTLKALEAGKKVLTANKETFVTAGHLIKPYLGQIIPLDSEHSAIFQCLQGCQKTAQEIHKLYLTASGGPFLNRTLSELEHIKPADALKHPNWDMGAKVTIDSATMMNKGLERIEATVLFDVSLEKVDVVIHPQSVVHSAVDFCDGSLLAQLGKPDMRVPIQYGLTYPERWKNPDASMHLNLQQLGLLDFSAPDLKLFPCLKLAEEAGIKGGSMNVVLNAADEVAVSAFLNEQIKFTDIPKMIEKAMQSHKPHWISEPTLDEIIQIDKLVREQLTLQTA